MITTRDLTERVTIQAEARTPNGQGGYTTNWANVPSVPTVWAAVRMLSGNEAINAGVQRSVQQWRVIIRRRADVTTKHRLLWGGLKLDIRSVGPLPDQPRDFLLMLCESGLMI